MRIKYCRDKSSTANKDKEQLKNQTSGLCAARFCLFLYFFSLCIRRPTVKVSLNAPPGQFLAAVQHDGNSNPTMFAVHELKGQKQVGLLKKCQITNSDCLCPFTSFISSCNFRTMQIHWDEDVSWCLPHWFHWLKINKQKTKNSIKCHWHVWKSKRSFKLFVKLIFFGFCLSI